MAWLNEHGIRAKHYHAKLDPALKAANQDAFRMEEGLCLVATVAFGMGINKPNVRYVAHLDLPASIEGYYQETGRAGRDGLPAEAFMLFGMQDIVQRSRMIDEGDSTDQIKRIERAKLNALVGICETASCRRQAILGHFGERHPGGCGNCDTCTKPVESWDGNSRGDQSFSCDIPNRREVRRGPCRRRARRKGDGIRRLDLDMSICRSLALAEKLMWLIGNPFTGSFWR